MSVTNFEKITENLTEKELLLLPYVKDALIRCTEAQNSGHVCELISMLYHKVNGEPLIFNGVRLRKYVSYIRVNGLLPVIATSQGYFVTEDKEEIEKQVKSLYERASQIKNAAIGMQKFL
jgi:hypothetical protein